MVKNHLSRLNAPVSWPIRRKGIKFVTKPSPGPHSLRTSISLNLVLQKLLKYAKTSKEVKKILHDGKVLVNNKVVRKDVSYPLGIMDIINLPDLKESYRVVYDDKGKFMLVKVDEKEANLKLNKIQEKTLLKKGKVQINYSDGTNLLLDKNQYKTKDTLVVSMKDNKIVGHLAFEKGAMVYLVGGKKVGRVGTLEDIKGNNVVIKSDGELFETATRHLFVVGKHKVKE